MTDEPLDWLPCFLDFEASSLGPDSYPIQVAWSLPDGEVESWFINPEGVTHWDDWDPNSEAVHGIQYGQLLEVGKPPRWVAQRMNEQLSGQAVYADGLPHDRLWCETLFLEAGSECRFQVEDFYELLLGVLPPTVTHRPGWFESYRQAARRRVVGRAHLADNDVRYLIELYRIAVGRRRSY